MRSVSWGLSLSICLFLHSGCEPQKEEEKNKNELAGNGDQKPKKPTKLQRSKQFKAILASLLSDKNDVDPEAMPEVNPEAEAAFPTKEEMLRSGMAAMDGPPDEDYDIWTYAEEVRKELGPIPSFNVFEKGALIPFTRDGVELAPGEHQADTKCDRPALLAPGHNIPYGRLGRLAATHPETGEPNPDVTWVFIARHYKIRQDPDFKLFEDVAIIGHHRKTGKTAFFQMLSKNAPKDGTRVPSPMEKASETPEGHLNAKEFWLSPQRIAAINCYNCHSADAWVHTPYVDQVTFEENGARKKVVPEGTSTSSSPPLSRPYSFIGSKYFSAWPKMMQFKPPRNKCVKCHRIGTTKLSRNFVTQSTGGAQPFISDSFKNYPKSHWMPPFEDGDAPELDDWEATFKRSVKQLLGMYDNPNDPRTVRFTIPIPGNE